MSFLDRIKNWFVKDTSIPDTHPTVQFFEDPRGVPEYRLVVIEGTDWTLRRRIRIGGDIGLPIVEEIEGYLKERYPDPLPNTDAEQLVAIKRNSLIDFIDAQWQANGTKVDEVR